MPYYVIVYPVNELGHGMRADAVGFTRALAPEIAPSVTNVARSQDGTEITVTWDPITLEQARGFFNYTITILEANARRRQLSWSQYPGTRPPTPRRGLDPNQQYQVTVGTIVMTSDGGTLPGPPSPPVTIGRNINYMGPLL